MAGQTDENNRKNKFSKQYIQASTLQCIAAQKVTLKRPIRQQRSQPSQNPGEQISGKLHWWQRWAFCWPKVTCLNQTFCLMMFCSTWKNAMRKLEWVTFWCPQLSPPNPPPSPLPLPSLPPRAASYFRESEWERKQNSTFSPSLDWLGLFSKKKKLGKWARKQDLPRSCEKVGKGRERFLITFTLLPANHIQHWSRWGKKSQRLGENVNQMFCFLDAIVSLAPVCRWVTHSNSHTS